MAETQTDVLVALPRPLTSLIGRDDELDHLYELLTSEAALVTITGFGGIGKTRLALQAALELEPHFDAGVIFAQLASVTRGSSIAIAVALTAGLDESVETIPALAEALGPSTRLLVLDNLEQIPDAAEIVLEFMRAMPQVTILATTRNRLELGGEYVLPLEPLETQSTNARSLPAVQLFIERGKAAAPSLPTDDDAIAVIAEICQKLDGIPLAIELAAARLAIFSLKDLRDQLQNILPILASNRVDMPDRQRTMRNAIAWTYELLEDPERRLFTWLSVYEQDFSLDSVKHVAHQLELTDDPLDLVQFLVSRSLVRPSRRETESPRYQMLQMLREFGHEHLKVMNEDQLARRSHAMDMVALAERAEPNMITSESKRWMRLLNDDLANILTALEWAVSQNEYEIAQRIVGATWRFLDAYEHSRRILALNIDLGQESGRPEARAKAMLGIAYFHLRAFRLDECEQLFQQALELTEDLPNKVLRVRILTGLGTTRLDARDLDQSQEYYRQAQALAEEIGDQRGQSASMSMLRNIKHQLHEIDEDVAMSEQLVELAHKEGSAIILAREYGNLGIAYISANRLDDAERALLTNLDYARDAGDLRTIGVAYVNLTDCYFLANKLQQARAMAEEGLLFVRESNLPHHEAVLLTALATLHLTDGDHGTTAQLLAQASRLINHDITTGEQLHIAGILAEIAHASGLIEQAAELMGAVSSLRDKLQIRPEHSRESAETDVINAVAATTDPGITEAKNLGSTYDRATLVIRIQAIAAQIAALTPPANPVSEREEAPAYSLTPRETEVLELVAKGHSNGEIAEEMFVSTRTVTTHISNIFNKLDVNNRARAIAVATQAGLVADR